LNPEYNTTFFARRPISLYRNFVMMDVAPSSVLRFH